MRGVVSAFVLGASIAATDCSANPTGVDGGSASVPQSSQAATGMKIALIVGDRDISGTLEDSEAGRNFARLLPLNLMLNDYNATEKIADLPARIGVSGSPDGIDPQPGDIAYFAPWGNLAIFYRDFSYSRGLVRLGRIEDNLDWLQTSRSLQERIERR